MSFNLETSWRARHARKLFLPLGLCALGALSSLVLEICIYQNLWISLGLGVVFFFLLVSEWQLYIQYKRLPEGSKGGMIRTIHFLEGVLPFLVMIVVFSGIINVIRFLM